MTFLRRERKSTATDYRGKRKNISIAVLEAEGRAAFHKGLPRSAFPSQYAGTTNLIHWLSGWDFEERKYK